MIFFKKRKKLKIFKDISIILGIVIIWRGMWYFLDYIDVLLGIDSGLLSSIVWILVGFLVLYLPDGDLKEIERL
jgi:hypothetical protein